MTCSSHMSGLHPQTIYSHSAQTHVFVNHVSINSFDRIDENPAKHEKFTSLMKEGVHFGWPSGVPPTLDP